MTGVHVRMGALLAAALVLLSVLAGAASADVVQRSSSTASGTASSFQLRNVAVSAGSGRLLAVGVATTEGQQVTGVAFGAQALTLRAARNSGETGQTSGARAELWTLSDPAIGSGTVTVTFSHNVDAVVGVSTYDGVDALNPITGPAEGSVGNGSANAASLVLNNTAGDADFSVLAVGNVANLTATPTLGPSTDTVTATSLWSTTAGRIFGAGATRSGNTGANQATSAGVQYHWNYADPQAHQPYAMLMAGLNKGSGVVAAAPSVTTSDATGVRTDGATLNGDVSSDNGSPITGRGFVLCLSPCTPTTGNPDATVFPRTGTTGALTLPVSGLSSGTTYQYATYATNAIGTSYGATKSFRTLVPNRAPVADAGGAYTVNEGSGLTLDASGSTDPDGDALTYAWDLDGDGQYDDATGVRPVLTPAQAASFGMGDGPASHTVSVQVTDPDGASSTASANVDVLNKAPTPSYSGVPAHAVEGTPWTLHVGATDPSAADTAAGIRFAVDTDDDGTWDVGSDSYAGATTQTDFTITPADSGRQTVDVLAIDKDGTSATVSIEYDVANVNPTATLSTGGAVGEGSNGTVSFSDQSDPSSADTAAGFRYAYDTNNDGRWDVGDGTYAGSSTSARADVPTTDNGTVTVRAKIIDKDGGSNTYTQTLTVDDVAPDGTVGNDGPVDEGTDAHVSVTDVSDPSSADTAAGFHYAYDVGDDGTWESGDGRTYAGSTTAASFTVPTTDEADIPVAVAIIDKDGGVTTHVTHVIVNGVAPVATLENDGPVDEGQDLGVRFSDPSDPSSADTAAGFHYAYDTDGDGTFDVGDGTYAGSPSDATLRIPTKDSGTFFVRAAIIDKDGLRTLFATRVTVNDVAPVAAVVAPDRTPVDTDLIFTVSATDVSPVDQSATFGYRVDWGDGTAPLRQNGSRSMLVLHRYATAGTYTLTVTATDKDNKTSAPVTLSVTIAAPAPPAQDTTTTPTTTTPAQTPVSAQSAPSVFAKVQSLTVSPRCVAAAAATSRAVRIRYRLSAAAAVRVTLERSTGSHAVARCPPLRGSQQSDGRYKPGTYAPVSTRQTTGSAGAGGTSLTIAKGSRNGAVGSVATVRPQALIAKGGKLAPGTYLLTVTTLSADGRPQDTARVKFWVLKARAKRVKKG